MIKKNFDADTEEYLTTDKHSAAVGRNQIYDLRFTIKKTTNQFIDTIMFFYNKLANGLYKILRTKTNN